MNAPRIAQALLAPVLGCAVCIVVILCFARQPGEALASLFAGAFTSRYYFGTMLNTAAFLMIAGCGAAIGTAGGTLNLGGEGQVYLGGFVACLLFNRLPGPAPLVCAGATLASLLAGSLMACVSAFLKELRGARVLLTSFLVSAAVIPLIDGIITALKSGTDTNMLALPYIADAYRLPQLLPPSPLTGSFFFALILCILCWYGMYRSTPGRTVRIWGAAPLFARYCGYSSAANSYGTLALSGALHALTGCLAVCGTYYTCHKGFYQGMGWNALNVALIARANPLAIIPTSLVLAWLFSSASRVALTQGFQFDIAGIVQGIILFAIAIPFSRGRGRNLR